MDVLLCPPRDSKIAFAIIVRAKRDKNSLESLRTGNKKRCSLHLFVSPERLELSTH